MQVRKTSNADLSDILNVHRMAFDREDIETLVRELLEDPIAQPILSLMAVDDGQPAGHILFTKALIEGAEEEIEATILAPLAVVPDAQGRGVGGKLINEGLRHLSDSHVDLVFVLGHPTYYPKHGFEPAGRLGLDAPYPIPEKDAEAWMVQALRPNVIGSVRGTVQCADAMNKPEHWRE